MKNLDVDLGYKPYEHQRAAHALRLTFRFLVLVWHRRAGKTVFAVLELLLAALACAKERGRYGYIAPLLKQAKGVAWDYLKHFARTIPGCVVNESELYVEFPNGARVRLFGADNPDSFRGLYFDGVVMDEVADQKPEAWGEIVRPALADRQGWAIFIGTPKGTNLFSELYYRAQTEPGWKADLRRASETGIIPEAELAQMRREMTPAQFSQEADCDFSASVDDVLLRLEDVLAAQSRSLPEHAYQGAPKVLGVDVARYGGDRSSIFLRQGQAAWRPTVMVGLDLMALSGRVAESIERLQPDATFIDQGGMGGGVVDRLRQLKFNVVGIDFGGRAAEERFENKRAEMWWSAAEWVKGGGCLPESQALAQDLTAPRYTYKNHRGRLQLESKDDLRARGLPSPDLGDSFVLTFAMPVAPKGARVRADKQQVVNRDFNPYAAGAD